MLNCRKRITGSNSLCSLSLSLSLAIARVRMEKQYGWGAVTDGLRKGPWTSQEDQLLIEHVKRHREGKWNSVSCLTGLKRCGKSCRLRWVNYLRPGLKRSKIAPHEETIIRQLHAQWGNRWSTIAKSLPGRTDNEIKNYWRTHFKKEKPAKRVEQARARFLRQKALLQQKQQQRLQQQVEEILFAQEMREMACLYSTPFQEEGFLAGGSMTGSEEISNGEDECYATWANLWNLDDVELTWGDEAYFVH